jgi:hypothetical protein
MRTSGTGTALTAFIGNATHAITSTPTFTSINSLFASVAVNPTLLFTGSADWNTTLGIQIAPSGVGGGGRTWDVADVQVNVTYTPAGGIGGIYPGPGVVGGSAQMSGLIGLPRNFIIGASGPAGGF